MEIILVLMIAVVIRVVMFFDKPSSQPRKPMSDDAKYMGAIMVDKHFHGDSNWTHPWEL
jgi:hypothetical protein